MKCDHIRTREQGDTPFFPNMLNNANVEVCLKSDVDEAIAELKADHYIDDCNNHDRFVMYGCFVTHWMPLPEPPEVG